MRDERIRLKDRFSEMNERLTRKVQLNLENIVSYRTEWKQFYHQYKVCLKKYADCLNCTAPAGSRGIHLVLLGWHRSADYDAYCRHLHLCISFLADLVYMSNESTHKIFCQHSTLVLPQ